MPEIPADAGIDLLRKLGGFLPRLAAALGLALLGWLAARLLRFLTVRLVRSWGRWLAGGLGRLLRNRDLASEMNEQSLQRPVAEAVGSVVFWLVLLFFMAAATEALGLPVVSAWLSGVASYLPRLLAAVLIVVLGLLAGRLARSALSAATSAAFAYSDVLGRVGQAVIVMASVIVAFDQLGVHVTFLTVLVGVVAGALLGAGALAFGLGASGAVSNIIAAHYLFKVYRVGHHVRIGAFEGRILEITPTAVVIATSEGRAVVPAREFSERASLLLTV